MPEYDNSGKFPETPIYPVDESLTFQEVQEHVRNFPTGCPHAGCDLCVSRNLANGQALGRLNRVEVDGGNGVCQGCGAHLNTDRESFCGGDKCGNAGLTERGNEDELHDLWDLAREHGESGDFEDGATHEVGDLQDLSRWDFLTPEEKAAVSKRFRDSVAACTGEEV